MFEKAADMLLDTQLVVKPADNFVMREKHYGSPLLNQIYLMWGGSDFIGT